MGSKTKTKVCKENQQHLKVGTMQLFAFLISLDKSQFTAREKDWTVHS